MGLNIFAQSGTRADNLDKIDSLKDVLNNSEYSQKACVYREIAREYQDIKPYKALYYTDSALTISVETKNDLCIAKTRTTRGGIFKNKAENKEALDCYFKALSYFEKVENKRWTAISCINLSVICLELNLYDKAYGYALRAKKIFHKLGLADYEYAAKINLGLILNNKDKKQEAKEIFYKLLETVEAHPSRAMNVYNGIGNILLEENKNDQALDLYFKAYELVYISIEKYPVFRLKSIH